MFEKTRVIENKDESLHDTLSSPPLRCTMSQYVHSVAVCMGRDTLQLAVDLRQPRRCYLQDHQFHSDSGTSKVSMGTVDGCY